MDETIQNWATLEFFGRGSRPKAKATTKRLK